jgi:hypothetical protein
VFRLFHQALNMLMIKKSNPETMSEKIKRRASWVIALVGLGNYAGGQLAPALLQTSNCYLAGIVTGTPSKIPVWKEKYKYP